MKESPSREDALADPTIIEAAIRRAVHEAVLTHARLGHAVPTWRDGRVVWLHPQEIFELLSVNAIGGNGASQ
jgi:hypothetical protein